MATYIYSTTHLDATSNYYDDILNEHLTYEKKEWGWAF